MKPFSNVSYDILYEEFHVLISSSSDSVRIFSVNYRIFISQITLQIASRPRMHFDKVFEKAARLIQDGGDGPAVRRE